ncbi:plasmid-related, DNA/RNA helicase [Burkholderia pseudomallei]|uniref:helicase-related protein n=1 Tax=Burkholderia pseudomallei TaxID=28450 RepID=UPI000F0466E5|nr:helicase-related protein [Burkholderia pseudomallei]CAJ2754595.1 plasmid-related, DNA/RNA helicase [Burkholderia pseudomallei]VCJ93074.1 plasmid-related, DNA/RNA helicase [Burkholderia pseudomallei]VCJ95189.1 plasmid-related, DNA/RNA helicase [Burkholderia pseudomallei]VCJ95508.1 plasmid-related, DNA/RNA helicase [Burkholderia pseudomallei]VCJ97819.1 plasmid-related, DNA/RNA helicase [Burkholderia pseudomallei]
MSLDTLPDAPEQGDLLEAAAAPLTLSLQDFVTEFGDELLDALNRANPPVYAGQPRAHRQLVLAGLKRRLFPAQADVVHAVTELLIERHERAAVVNGEMGCGKTTVGIATAAVLHAEGYRRTLVLSPPHLVYKWRREILETVAGAKVWVLNGPDTLVKLMKLREALHVPVQGQEFFVLGRVRMRMGFHWKPAFVRRRTVHGSIGACPHCGDIITDLDGEPINPIELDAEDIRRKCAHCTSPLWTLMRPRTLSVNNQSAAVLKALKRIPTIGEVTAQKLMKQFGEAFLASMLGDNLFEFINLMDEHGELVFSDRQAQRMERAMANMEFGFGEGGYQPSEYIKRYLPQGTFDLLIADEAHEYKNAGSAQGQAMGVLAAKARKMVLLTGTLMGGYADDLFFLLFRSLPGRMIEDGYRPTAQGSLTSAAMAFMRDHGVLKDIYSESTGSSHKTAKGSNITVRTVKAPGFGPKGVLRCVLPFTVFLKLKDIGGNVLPPYDEEFRDVAMMPDQASAYRQLSGTLTMHLKQALAKRDTTLLGVVLNVLLAWPDTCFRSETVKHPRTHAMLAFTPAQFGDLDVMPKERELIDICRQEKAVGRKTLVYSVYSGTRDTTSRLKMLLEQNGFKVAVLRASVEASRREDWIAEQLDRGIDVLITNPDLVKTGLDLLEFPTIVFMQSGYNVYTLQQAARRSWRIGQKQPVKVIYLGYADTSQMHCLTLMAKKIAVSQSTSGDVPDSGLDVLNQDGDSVEVALARQLVH